MYKKTILTIIMALSLQAHSLWVNALTSSSHNDGHIMLFLGWGHTLPLGDSTNSINGRIRIESFELIKPNGEKYS